MNIYERWLIAWMILTVIVLMALLSQTPSRKH
jgi:hypothetical protein